jgi:transposase InsO family protein
MPWKAASMSDIRLVFVHHVLTLHTPIAAACRQFSISRKTGYKWLSRYRRDSAQPLTDRSRRPRSSPRRTSANLEAEVLQVRQQFGWGPRKIRAFLIQQKGLALPSVRTVANILTRHGCIATPAVPQLDLQCFERPRPNQLWQCDFKGPLEIARQDIHPFTILDDHSRFLLAIRPCLDLTMATAFTVLWETFAEVGLPESILCDNAFGTTFEVPKTISWFESQLIRLDIRPIHGRPYHPQTQGKVERVHGTFEAELYPRVRRDSLSHFAADADHWRRAVYNTLRPHEALGDMPPVSRYRPSPRRRPDRIPDVVYPAGAVLRKVSTSGDICWRRFRILAGRGLVGQWVRVEEQDQEVAVYFGWKKIRSLDTAQLKPQTML